MGNAWTEVKAAELVTGKMSQPVIDIFQVRV